MYAKTYPSLPFVNYYVQYSWFISFKNTHNFIPFLFENTKINKNKPPGVRKASMHSPLFEPLGNFELNTSWAFIFGAANTCHFTNYYRLTWTCTTVCLKTEETIRHIIPAIGCGMSVQISVSKRDLKFLFSKVGHSLQT